MLRTMMTSKIHRATVTQADLDYVGSVTVDEILGTMATLEEVLLATGRPVEIGAGVAAAQRAAVASISHAGFSG